MFRFSVPVTLSPDTSSTPQPFCAKQRSPLDLCGFSLTQESREFEKLELVFVSPKNTQNRTSEVLNEFSPTDDSNWFEISREALTANVSAEQTSHHWCCGHFLSYYPSNCCVSSKLLIFYALQHKAANGTFVEGLPWAPPASFLQWTRMFWM